MNWQPPQYQHQQFMPPPQIQVPPPQQGKAKNYAIAALVFFLLGVFIHLFAIVPLFGIMALCVAVLCDLAGFVFLILVIASL